jgi:hypothetical protein
MLSIDGLVSLFKSKTQLYLRGSRLVTNTLVYLCNDDINPIIHIYINKLKAKSGTKNNYNIYI